MPVPSMSSDDLITAQNLLRVGGPSSAYTFLETKGFDYATLAHSVIKGTSAFATVSLNYMMLSAAEADKPMSQADIDNVMNAMAQGYIDALANHIDPLTNTINSDVTYAEAWSFHSNAFESNGYPANSWTLNAVFSVLDEPSRKNYWAEALNAAGNPLAEGLLAGNTLHLMSMIAALGVDGSKELAQTWTDRVNSPSSLMAGGEGLYETLILKIDEMFNAALNTVSPLILDLNGDGVKTLGLSDTVYFDHNGDGFAEKTGWVGKDDGFLVWDRNQNGEIDNGGELFGSFSKLNNGTNAANGFLALQELDSNNDGKINSTDKSFSLLKVWKDGNSNGVVDNEELFTLTEAKVTELSTQYKNINSTDSNGNQALQAGSYTTSYGNSLQLTDIWFVTNQALTINLDTTTISENASKVPNLLGMGTVPDLRLAISQDSSGYLESQLNAFYTSTENIKQHAILRELIYSWSKVSDHAISSRGDYIDDARKLYSLESFLGIKFSQSAGTNEGTGNPGPNAAAALMKTFDTLENFYYSSLMIEGEYKPLLSSIKLTYTDGRIGFDTDSFMTKLQEAYTSKGEKASEYLKSFSAVLLNAGDSWPDLIEATRLKGDANGTNFLKDISEFGRLISQSNGSELYGSDANESFLGRLGNDYIYGGKGQDFLEGGGGNDYLSGDEGSDTYFFSRGWGQDRINNYDLNPSNIDYITFDSSISNGDVYFSRSGENLNLSLQGSTDNILIINYFNRDINSDYKVDFIKFSNGVSWDTDFIKNIVSKPTNNNDELHDYQANAVIFGLGGDDVIYSGKG
ncbi:calcium-binding protein, partial [Pseudomonas syringae]